MESFLSSLFDFSFRRFITPSLLKFVYMGSVALAGLEALGIILAGFSQGVLPGLLGLIIAPIVFLLLVCFARVAFETVLSVFRIANYTAELARAQRKGQADRDDSQHDERAEPVPEVPVPPRPPGTDKSGF